MPSARADRQPSRASTSAAAAEAAATAISGPRSASRKNIARSDDGARSTKPHSLSLRSLRLCERMLRIRSLSRQGAENAKRIRDLETSPGGVAARQATCGSCDHKDLGRCLRGGCNSYLWAKIRIANQKCPVGKW